MINGAFFTDTSLLSHLPEKLQVAVLRFGMNNEAREDIYNQLRMLISAGINQTQALNSMLVDASDNGEKPNNMNAAVLRHVITRMSEGSSEGTGFSDGLRPFIPDTEYFLLKSCEVGNRLEMGLVQAIQTINLNGRIQELTSGIGWRIFFNMLMVVTTLVITGMFVLPQFDKIYPMERWTGLGASMVWMYGFIKYGLAPTVILGIIGGYFIAKTMPVWTGPGRAIADNFMPWSIYSMNAGVQFMSSLSSMISTGTTVSNALETFSESSRGWLRERVSSIAHHLSAGAQNIGEAMYLSGYNFPSRRIVQNLRVVSLDSGNLEEALRILNEQWLKSQVALIERKAKVIDNMSSLFNMLAVAWVFFALQSIQDQMTMGMTGRM